jgi:hypothetical protein
MNDNATTAPAPADTSDAGQALPAPPTPALVASPPAEPDPAEETAAERLFGSRESLRTDYGPALKDSLDRLSDSTGATPEQLQGHLDAVAEVFSDARINSREASGLHSLLVSHLSAPVDDATVQQWETESRRELREQYGDDAGRRLAAAQKFVAARPDLQRTLDETGLGSHPRVILALAEKANGMRMVPRKRK